MSYDVSKQFFPVTTALLQQYLPRLHDCLFPDWAQAMCQAVPPTVEVGGVTIKHPGLLPFSLLGAAIGIALGGWLLWRWSNRRGGFSLALAYLLFGFMNISGTVFHCLLPIDSDATSVAHHVAYAADVGFTSTSCVSLLLAAATLLDLLEDRSLLLRRSTLTGSLLVLVVAHAVTRLSQHYPLVNFLNEQLYCNALLLAYSGLLLFAHRLQRGGRLPRDAGRWLVVAIVCSWIALPGLLFDKFLCFYLGRHVNLLTCGYAACDLVMADLFLFFMAVMRHGEAEAKRA